MLCEDVQPNPGPPDVFPCSVCGEPVLDDDILVFFFPSAIRLWNCLSTDIASINDFNEFNMKLQQHLSTYNIIIIIILCASYSI